MIDDTKTLKHIRIYNWLREMIDRGRFLADEKLPTEIEIEKKFGVNRMTVRQSMDMLVNEGIVIRKRGKGTFLLKKPDKVNYLLDNIISFEGIAKEHNFKSRYEVIHRSVEIASSEIASCLLIPVGSEVIHLQRLISGNDIPMYIETSYFPYAEFKELLELDLNQPAIYSLIAKAANEVTLDHSTQVFSASLLTEKEKECLCYNQAEQVPCIRQTNIIYNSNDIPMIVFNAVFPGDRFQFTVHSGNFSGALDYKPTDNISD